MERRVHKAAELSAWMGSDGWPAQVGRRRLPGGMTRGHNPGSGREGGGWARGGCGCVAVHRVRRLHLPTTTQTVLWWWREAGCRSVGVGVGVGKDVPAEPRELRRTARDECPPSAQLATPLAPTPDVMVCVTEAGSL